MKIRRTLCDKKIIHFGYTYAFAWFGSLPLFSESPDKNGKEEFLMSEKQYKKVRKQEASEPHKKPADKKNVIFNIVSVIVILAFLGVASYAVVREMGAKNDTAQTNASDTGTDTSNTDTSTLGGYAEATGTTFDALAEKCGLDKEKFTADMSTEEAFDMFTLENMAKMSDKDIDTFKTELELPADVKTDVPNKELSTEIMMKVNGIPYSLEDLKAYGVSDDITNNTKWADAKNVVYEAASKKMSEEQSQNNADGGAE